MLCLAQVVYVNHNSDLGILDMGFSSRRYQVKPKKYRTMKSDLTLVSVFGLTPVLLD
jgi:hypothetical protein